MTKTPMTEQWVENVHFTLIPNKDNGWDVRILEGDLVETVIRYNTVKFDEENMMVNIDYDLIYTPDTDLAADDQRLKDAAGAIIHSLFVRMIEAAENGQ